MNRFVSALAAAATISAICCGGASAAIVYSLADNGVTLVRFDSNAPGAVSVVGAISGATSRLDGMDFRPADGRLYGYSSMGGGIYVVDIGSGATSLVSTANQATADPAVGIDFNPVPDRMRLVNSNDQNLRINVATGVALVDGTLAYAAADVNAGVNPNIVDAAYTNHDRNPATGTTLYYIDSVLDALVSTSSPNAGLLSTVGALGVDVDEFTGFDIFTDASGVNTAFASFTNARGQAGLYTVNLATGAASLIGAIGGIGGIGVSGLDGLAAAPVPIAPVWALMLVAGLAGWGLRLRR